MLWYKAWLETRFRVLFAILFVVFPIPLFTLTQRTLSPSVRPPLAALEGIAGFFALYWAIVPLNLAGTGVKTQASARAQKGVHGSMLFTLSMPVSRFQLFATRASLGMLEAAAVLALAPAVMWFTFPGLRALFTGSSLFEYWLTIAICVSPFYGLNLLLSALFDDSFQNWIGIFSVVLLYGALASLRVPASLNIFRAMGQNSPLFTHSLPWGTMGIALSVALILCSIAFQAIRTREY
jgi:hypothetical protein